MVRLTQPHLGPLAVALAGLAVLVPSAALPSDVATAAEGPPVNVAAPTVTGQASDGELLVADKGRWSGSAPIKYTYRWERCDGLGAACSAIDGATSKSYTLQPADVGNRLRIKVTATNAEGSASAESGPTDVVSPSAPVNTAAPSISGVPQVGQTLKGDTGAWAGTPDISFAWQWRRCDASGSACADIPDATADSYTVAADDLGHTLRLGVNATNAAGSGTGLSAPTAPVSDASPPPPENAPPQADFVFFPAQPVVGEQVDLVSISSDPDGALAQQEWDLDGDGQFDDASGVRAAESFAAPGAHTVGLRVTDGAGAVDVKSLVIQVANAPAAITTAPEATGPVPALAVSKATPVRLLPMSPAPVVRIQAQLLGAGLRIRVLSVRAPRGASIEARCRGAGCPVKRLRARVSRAAGLRLRRLEVLLKPGARLELFVRQAGHVGKYTRFRIRSGKPPARYDGCVAPGADRPSRCPVG